MGRPAANTKLGHKRVHPVRCRGGNMKYRALRLDTGNFSWGTEGESTFAAIGFKLSASGVIVEKHGPALTSAVAPVSFAQLIVAAKANTDTIILRRFSISAYIYIPIYTTEVSTVVALRSSRFLLYTTRSLEINVVISFMWQVVVI